MPAPEEFSKVIASCTMLKAIEADFLAELARLEAESISWIPLEDGTYLHVGSEDGVAEIVGVADAAMAGLNVLRVL
jgi:hypothetical protein